MTYNEIEEHIWTADGDVDARVESLSERDRRAWRVIRLFESRKGFGGWWGNIDDETQDEIFAELQSLIGPPHATEPVYSEHMG